MQPLLYNHPCMSVRNVPSPSVLEPAPPGRHFAACVHEIQFELRRDQSVSGKNNPSFCSRFCLNCTIKHLCRTSVFLISWHRLGEAFSEGFPIHVLAKSHETSSFSSKLASSSPSPRLWRGIWTFAALLQARLICRSGPSAKMPNYLESRFEMVSIAGRRYKVAFRGRAPSNA